MMGFGSGGGQPRKPLDHEAISKILGSTYYELENPPSFGGPVDLTPKENVVVKITEGRTLITGKVVQGWTLHIPGQNAKAFFHLVEAKRAGELALGRKANWHRTKRMNGRRSQVVYTSIT